MRIMGFRKIAYAAGLTGVMALGANAASVQEFPSRPIRIVTAEIGGGNDFAARILAQGMMPALGKPVIVENRGGSVVVSAQLVGKAQPDGHTLLLYGSNLWILPFMRDKVPYDPIADFSPITTATSSPCVLVVHPSLPVKSTSELIALAKAKPGQLNYAGASGGIIHIAAEVFKAMAGLEMVYVPYKGGSPALMALVAGQVQLMFPTAGTVAPHIKSGRFRALAITSAQRSSLFPELPTIAATGLPGYESVARFAVLAPAKTPAAIVNRLNQEMVRVLAMADVKEKFNNAGIEPVGSTPAQLAATMKSEMARQGKMIKAAGIRAE
jgi:tripartite-type tricarboxylate transporter receptor subunit TctC